MDCFTSVLTRILPAGKNTIAPGLPPPDELSAHSDRPQPGRQVVGSGRKNLVSWTKTTQRKLVHDIPRRLQLQEHLGKHVRSRE